MEPSHDLIVADILGRVQEEVTKGMDLQALSMICQVDADVAIARIRPLLVISVGTVAERTHGRLIRAPGYGANLELKYTVSKFSAVCKEVIDLCQQLRYKRPSC